MIALATLLALVTGWALGWFFVPWVSDTLLCRSYARTISWWRDSCEAYRRFRRRWPGVVPLASAPGWEGALGIWHAEALREAAEGTLTVERLGDLADVGVAVDRVLPACTEEERKLLFRFDPKTWHRAILAIFGVAGTFGALMLAFGAGGSLHAVAVCPGVAVIIEVLVFVSLVSCVVGMMTATVCDLRARVIPLEACVVVAISGIAFQAMAYGPVAVGFGALFAAGIGVACSLANRIYRIRSPTDAVGRGDIRCMAALSLASGTGALCGLVACYACAALFAAMGCLLRRLKAKDGVPMAPFLAVWLVCGMAAGVVGP